MASVLDVAAYILQKQGPMTAMKLQKLVYYAQAWHMVWEEEPLFTNRIEAWANGPVCPTLYHQHKGKFRLTRADIDGDARKLSADERESITAVLKAYGKKSAHWLSELTHKEPPWVDARKGLGPGERGGREIMRSNMAEYYEGLL